MDKEHSHASPNTSTASELMANHSQYFCLGMANPIGLFCHIHVRLYCVSGFFYDLSRDCVDISELPGKPVVGVH